MSKQTEQMTTRQQILSTLLEAEDPMTVREISQEVGASEKDIIQHLEHINRSIQKKELKMRVIPARCKACNFNFQKRKDFKKPSKCPLCKSEYLDPPSFIIQSK